jgi:3alpha(or 20beta)-hydroxysteroid dehydrogenase
MEFFSLKNKVAVVTGGGSGLGLATVKRFVQAGAKVVLSDISDKTELAKELGCLYLKADVSKEEDVANLMEQTYKYYGQIDIVINNAGIIMPEQLLTDANMKDYQKLYSVNVFGVVHGLKYAPRYMKEGELFSTQHPILQMEIMLGMALISPLNVQLLD